MKRIPLKKENLSLYFDANKKPVEIIESGETVVFECIDCYDGQIRDENTLFKDIVKEDNNPITGPLYINGAKRGDILKIDILDIKIADKAVMSVRPNAGVYNDILTECVSKIIEINKDVATFKTNQGDIILKIKPMIGGIGVAPSCPILSTLPSKIGGNLDCKYLTKDTSLYLPVEVEGGLLSMGDLHALQGDGETVICALEVDGEVTVKVTVLKDTSLPMPFISTKDSYIVLSESEDLDKACTSACKNMHHFLSANCDVSKEDIGMLLSIVGDVRISQVVNGVKGCYMKFPKNVLTFNKEY